MPQVEKAIGLRRKAGHNFVNPVSTDGIVIVNVCEKPGFEHCVWIHCVTWWWLCCWLVLSRGLVSRGSFSLAIWLLLPRSRR